MAIYFNFIPQAHENDRLDVAEISQTADVCTKTVHRWIKSGQLPAEQLGRRQWFVRRGDLETFLADRSRPANAN